jgi:hypothetical protein
MKIALIAIAFSLATAGGVRADEQSNEALKKRIQEMLDCLPKDHSQPELCRALWDITSYVITHAGRATPEAKLKLRPRAQYLAECKEQDAQLVACNTVGLWAPLKKPPKECEQVLADRAANEKFRSILFDEP